MNKVKGRTNKGSWFSLVSITLILIIWKFASLIIDADIILPPPEIVIKSLINIITKKNFSDRVLNTLFRGLAGFTISYISGIILGLCSGLSSRCKFLLQPITSIIRSTPVISIILLALIWFKNSNVPIFVGFLMSFPIIYGNVVEGISTVDKVLLEMANIYKIKLKTQIISIYLPSLVPFILAGASLSLGVVWKSVIAAEVLSQPKWGIGTSLNEAKSFLITEEVLAWTFIAILLSVLTEHLFRLIHYLIQGKNYGHSFK